jgi:hypothetical protein
MTGTVGRPPVRDTRDRGRAWWGVFVAWLVAAPVVTLTLMLEWGLAREYGRQDAGQYLLVMPAMLLGALATWLTLRAADRRRWAELGALCAALAVGAAAFGAMSWGRAVRADDVAAACSVEDLEVLSELPMYDRTGGNPQGYPDGGCYLRYPVSGDLAAAREVLRAELTAAGWAERAEPRMGEPSVFVRGGIELFADVEGLWNLEQVEATTGITAFRLTLFIRER